MSLRKGKQVDQYDFSGGINLEAPGHLIGDNECYASRPDYDGTRNVYWDGGVKQRRGTANTSDAATGANFANNGIRHYRDTAPFITTLAAIDFDSETKLMWLDTATLTNISGGSAIATAMDCYFASWRNACYVASGNQVIQKLTYSGGWARADITGLASAPQFICQHKDRLFAAGGNMNDGYMECCDYDDDTEWAAGDGEAFNVGLQDGDPITQLISLKDDLIVYKHDSIWKLQGDNLYNWFQHRDERSRGCVAPRSVAAVPGGHVFLSEDNVYFFDGQNMPLALGNKIKPWLDAIPPLTRPLAAATFYDGFYRLAIGSDDASAYNDKELWLDLRNFSAGKIAWWIMDGRNVHAWIPYTGTGDDLTLHYCDGNAEYLRQADVGNQDLGSDYTKEFHTKWYTYGSPNRAKEYDRIKADVATGVGDVTLTVKRNLNSDFSQEFALDTLAAGTTYGSAVLGTTYWSSQSEARLTAEIALPSDFDGYALAFHFRHEDNYDDVAFYGLSTLYKNKAF